MYMSRHACIPRLYICQSDMIAHSMRTRLFYLFICQNMTYNIHGKFTMQQAGQTGGYATLMSGLNLD